MVLYFSPQLDPTTGVVTVAGGGTGASTAAGARTNLGLGTIATQNANAVTISGGSVTGITDLAVADGGTGAGTDRGAVANLGTWYVLAKSGVAVPNTGNTAENTLATITVPQNAMGPNGMLRITALWSAGANNANVKTTRVRFDANTVSLIALTSGLAISTEQILANRNAANSQVFVAPSTPNSFALSTFPIQTMAVNTGTAARDITLTAQCADAGDTITLEFYMVELLYGA